MNQINVQHHRTELGELTAGCFRGRLCMLSLGHTEVSRSGDSRTRKRLDAQLVEQDDPILQETRKQIDEYLGGSRRAFDIPLLLVGTDFQKSVWSGLLNVPYGATATYAQIAEAIGNERAVRAVGSACKANPIGIIVPCHRIVGSGGSLGGYYGGLSLKSRLLNLERGHASMPQHQPKASRPEVAI
jgi:methylated-DNA-[protein]-cysteine S-methyltransferase